MLADCEANLECLQCGKPLAGNQTKYCCRMCKNKHFRVVNHDRLNAKARERMREKRLRDPEGCNANQKEWKQQNRDKTRLYRQRAKAKSLGVSVEDVQKEAKEKADKAMNEQKRADKAMNDLAKKNARQAWVYWLRVKAPMGWLARYWKAEGRPWKNMRIKAAARVRIRRRLDEDFRQYDILRSGYKKELKKRRSDGTVNAAALLRERKACPYCGDGLSAANVAIDHLVPLDKGGAHSAANLVACCASCNAKKRAKEFHDWVLCIPEKYKKESERMFKSKTGAWPKQAVMQLW